MREHADVEVTVLPHGETTGGLVPQASRQRDLAWHRERDAITGIGALVG